MPANTASNSPWSWSQALPALVSFLVWGAAAASIVAWGLAFWPANQLPLAPAVGSLAMPNPVQAADIGRVLGASPATDATAPAAPSTASRLSLIGVAKSGARNMVALIAVDGQAAKPFARGSEVLPGLVLQSVSLQQATLGAAVDAPAQLQLDMPKRAEPATGTLP